MKIEMKRNFSTLPVKRLSELMNESKDFAEFLIAVRREEEAQVTPEEIRPFLEGEQIISKEDEAALQRMRPLRTPRVNSTRGKEVNTCVTQEWTHALPMMQQTVLLTAIRGPDGMPKYGAVKMLLRWYRRCVLLSAMDGKVLENPYDNNGGSFTGPSLEFRMVDNWEVGMNDIVDEYLRTLDALPHHFQMHFMHAAEILGYKHPDIRTRLWWKDVYLRLTNDMHVRPEEFNEMNERLGDNRSGWLKRADKATVN